MRKISILTALILLILGNLAAQSSQDEKPYRIGAGLGYSFTGYREETYSPVNRYLNTLTFLLDANIEKRNFFHSFNLGFFMGDSKIKAEEAYLQREIDHQTGEAFYNAINPRFLVIRGNFEYTLDHKLWGNNVFPGYLGGTFRTDAYLQFANYPSITALISLGLHATQKWIINSDNTLTLSLGLPFFGYGVRPPYAGADAALIQYAAEQPIKIVTMGKVISLHNYWACFSDLIYQHRVNSLLSLNSGIGFELSRINFPRPRADAILRISSGIAFTF